LAPNFICTANIEPTDSGTAIAAGNAKVLAARLSDAKFFWEQDLKVPLEEQAKKLGSIVFHEKLGTVADKVDRVAKLARWLVEEGIVKPKALSPVGRGLGEGERGQSPSATTSPSETLTQPSPDRERALLADHAQQAARLCKADLVTGMVGEFPELQGIMGGYYARAEGLPAEVADAIRDHYKPVGQGDDVPTAPVTVAVSLADKLDTLFAFFAMQERPTGSRDPFALRRAALGLFGIVVENEIRLSILKSADKANEQSEGFLQSLWHPQTGIVQLKGTKLAPLLEPHPAFAFDLLDFLADRLKVQQREAGVRHDLIDAVFALGGEDDLVRLLARVKALQAFVSTGDGANLLAGYKRAANILKKEGVDSPLPLAGGDQGVGSRFPQTGSAEEGAGPPPAPPASGRGDSLSYTPEREEADLIAALDAAEGKAAAAVAAEDFEGAMTALASLRAPIDAFFETVTVNDADSARRAARLALLARVRAAVHQVADFSRIEG